MTKKSPKYPKKCKTKTLFPVQPHTMKNSKHSWPLPFWQGVHRNEEVSCPVLVLVALQEEQLH